MKHLYVFVSLCLCLIGSLFTLSAQFVPPNQPEQDCINALPICSPILPVPFTYQGGGLNPNEINGAISCLGGGEENDVWFKFLVQDTGIIDFIITPVNLADDYDWAVYNLTNAGCSDIANIAALEVACNFSGLPGNTGPTSSLPPGGQINLPIPVLAGETYVLNVSNWTGAGSGFTLDFSNSTSLAYDTTLIAISSVTNLSTLNGLLVIMNEPILCSQVDLGDFQVTDPNGTIIPIVNASPINCDSSFTDSIAIFLNPQIPLAQLLTFSVALTADVVYLCSQDTISLTPFQVANLNTSILTQTFGSNPNICQGDSVLLFTPFTGLSGFQSVWMPGNIQADQLMIVADSSINYTVTTQFVASGLSGNADIKLSTDSYPNWTELNDTTTCAKTLLIGSNDSSLTYLWSNNSTNPSFVVDTNQAGTYSVMVSSAGGCSVMDTFSVSFATYPVTQLNYTVGASPLDISFSSNASNVDSVNWDFGDGNSATGLNATHIYQQSGTYQVILSAYSYCGTKRDTINIDAFASSLGADYLPGVKLWLSQGMIRLEIAQLKASHYELTLWDLNGKQITQTQRVESHQSQWPVDNLPQGMYLAQLVDPEAKVVHLSKVVKL